MYRCALRPFYHWFIHIFPSFACFLKKNTKSMYIQLKKLFHAKEQESHGVSMMFRSYKCVVVVQKSNIKQNFPPIAEAGKNSHKLYLGYIIHCIFWLFTLDKHQRSKEKGGKPIDFLNFLCWLIWIRTQVQKEEFYNFNLKLTPFSFCINEIKFR